MGLKHNSMDQRRAKYDGNGWWVCTLWSFRKTSDNMCRSAM